MRRDRDADFTAYASGRWASLVRAAVLLGCSQQDAEDLAQAALVKTWSHWKRVSQATEPDAYVYRVMVNTLSTNRRRRWHGEQPTEDVPDSHTDDHTATVVLRHAVTTALRRLPREQQQVLVLRYVADLTERATADVLGVAVGTVKSRTSRALAALNPADFTDLAGDEP
ncbi:SigE family RNA polymerase sigma factor [Nocardioides plantarum]|uniref:SigE family RNA polymerase sigma factor n=1 Tax=Nocardioides plantarum TaxID=29299 RepID=A0ABV5K8H4_9ACTN|nr:SigE family RNA polymerase sigma factor [Nocardioides plantarum]